MIELVVVIAVIGILAAIAIPRVTGITKDARDKATNQHVAILNSAVERYKAETGDDKLKSKDADKTDEKDKGLNDFVSGEKKGTAAALIKDLQELNYLSKDVGETLPDTNKKLGLTTDKLNFEAKNK